MGLPFVLLRAQATPIVAFFSLTSQENHTLWIYPSLHSGKGNQYPFRRLIQQI
jgi:hypothetical protein